MKKNLDIFFKALYLVLLFFIYIGEETKQIFLFLIHLPVQVLKIILRLVIILSKKVKFITVHSLNEIKNNCEHVIKKRRTEFKKYSTYITDIKFPKIKLPKFRFPKLPSLPKFQKFHLPKTQFTPLKFPKFHFTPIKVSKTRKVIRIPKKASSFKFLSIKVRYFLIGSFATLMIVLTYQGYEFVKALPNPASIGKVNYPLSSHIYDRNGKLLYEIYREQNRTPVSLKDLSPYVYQATIAIEDKDFYHHGGISFISGIIRAVRDSIIKKNLQGGSTITQQLVKSALLTPERTIQRKIKEIILAVWTEQLYTKDQILEMYLNQVPYGGSSYGIEEAAEVYFGKHANELTLEQAALLAGLPQAPSVYSPNVNPQLALERRNEVLKAMKDQGYIDENLKLKAQNSKLETVPLKTAIKAPHFVFYVKSQLESLYGIRAVEEGGFKVITSLDLDIQEQAEKILKEELDKLKSLNVTNGAILVTRPSTGEILAMVGSGDYFAEPSGAFNVTTALRQPGSSIKPIMYSLALQKNYTAATIIDDSPIVFNIAGSLSYKPVNYDGKFHGKVPLRYALANSFNIPAVKVLSTIGVQNFINQASKMGITTWTDPARYGLSLTLGGGEVTMIDMATAFGVLANEGYKTNLTSSIKVEDVNGTIFREMNPYKIRVLDQGISYILSDILSDNFARQWAFGSQSALVLPGYQVAVKTGTTDDKKDNWTIGYTPDFLVTVWVGNNDNTPMNPYLTSGITGAAPIWNRVMSYLLKNYSNGNNWYSMPDDVISKTCYFGRTEYFLKGTEKSASCSENLFGTTPTPTPTP